MSDPFLGENLETMLVHEPGATYNFRKRFNTQMELWQSQLAL